MIQRICLILLFVLGINATLSAQQLIKGTIKDAETGEAIPFASVVYKGHNQAVISDIDGNYSIRRHLGWQITFSAVGYQSQVITITNETQNELDIALKSDKLQLTEVTVTTKRSRYSRKNNPAVELMKKVIAANMKKGTRDVVATMVESPTAVAVRKRLPKQRVTAALCCMVLPCMVFCWCLP